MNAKLKRFLLVSAFLAHNAFADAVREPITCLPGEPFTYLDFPFGECIGVPEDYLAYNFGHVYYGLDYFDSNPNTEDDYHIPTPAGGIVYYSDGTKEYLIVGGNANYSDGNLYLIEILARHPVTGSITTLSTPAIEIVTRPDPMVPVAPPIAPFNDGGLDFVPRADGLQTHLVFTTWDNEDAYSGLPHELGTIELDSGALTGEYLGAQKLGDINDLDPPILPGSVGGFALVPDGHPIRLLDKNALVSVFDTGEIYAVNFDSNLDPEVNHFEISDPALWANVYWFSVNWRVRSRALHTFRRDFGLRFLEAWGNAPNGRKGAKRRGRLRLSDRSSHTRPAIPGGLDASRARFRFTGGF